jgi:cytochrome c556
MESASIARELSVKRLVLAAAAIAAIVTAAVAQTGGAADTIRTRQANYKQMGGAMRAINEQLHGGSPSLDVIRPAAHLIATDAVQLLRWFPAGSGAEAGVRTRALPIIWTDQVGFRQDGAALLIAARNLDSAAQRGDLDAVRAAVPQLGHACGTCHDTYRAPDH